MCKRCGYVGSMREFGNSTVDTNVSICENCRDEERIRTFNGEPPIPAYDWPVRS